MKIDQFRYIKNPEKITNLLPLPENQIFQTLLDDTTKPWICSLQIKKHKGYFGRVNNSLVFGLYQPYRTEELWRNFQQAFLIELWTDKEEIGKVLRSDHFSGDTISISDKQGKTYYQHTFKYCYGSGRLTQALGPAWGTYQRNY